MSIEQILETFELRATNPLFEGQAFIWCVWTFYPSWKFLKHTSPFWSRRHIRQNGSYKTLCYQPISNFIVRWSDIAAVTGPQDECPECRGMAKYYADKMRRIEVE